VRSAHILPPGRQRRTAGVSATTFAPRVHLELSELARLRGDEPRCEREVEVALRLLRRMGAGPMAERVAVGVG
jgi:hypothetical protein